MKTRLLLPLAAGALLAFAAASAAATVTGRGEAVRACTSLRTSLGTQTFALSFGTRSASAAFGTCVSRFTPTGNAAVASARSQCAGKKGTTFATCVQLRADAKVNALVSSFKNAALTCKSQLRSLGPAAFASRYAGVSHNLANAYGKCVSSQVSHAAQAPTTAPSTEQFAVALTSLNGSTAHGTATLTLKGGELTVTVSLAGLEADRPHPLVVGSGSTCTALGPSLLDLTPVPTATASGAVDFTRVYQVNAGVLMPLADRTVVVEGLTVNGTYDQTQPAACGPIPS